MKQIVTTLLCSLFIVVINGCGKDNDETPPPPADTPGTITYTAPSAGFTFANGTNLRVSGTAADNDGLRALKIEVKNATTGTTYFQQELTIAAGVTYNFDQSWTVTGITANTNAIVKVTITDAYSYKISKDVAVVLQN